MMWPIKTLQEVCLIVTDGTHKTPKYQQSGVRFISIKNIRPFIPINWLVYEKYITQEEHNELIRKVKPEKDDILFPRIGTLGFAKRIDFDEEVSIFVGLGIAKPNKEIIRPKFLEYYMNTSFVDRYSRENAKGTGRLTLPLSASRKLPVPLPSLDIQDKVINKTEELLSDIDATNNYLNEALELVPALRNSILNSLYAVDPQSPIVKLSDHSVIKGGKRLPKGSTYASSETAHPYIRVTDFENMTVSVKNLKYIDEDVFEAITRYTISAKDLYISIAGTIGRVGSVPDKLDGANLTENAAKITDISGFDKDYLKYALNSPVAQGQIGQLTISTTQPKLALFRAGQIKLHRPEIEIQKQAVLKAEENLSLLEQHRNNLLITKKMVQEQKKTLLSKIFKGELV